MHHGQIKYSFINRTRLAADRENPCNSESIHAREKFQISSSKFGALVLVTSRVGTRNLNSGLSILNS